MSQDADQPQEIEVKDFFYKQMRKLRVFKSPQDLITARSSLLAVSNQYGIVYVAGDNNCVKAIHISTVEKLFIEVDGSLQVEEERFPSTDIAVGYPFSHIALSCDELTLAVCFERDGTCLLGFLDVRAFFSTKSPKGLFAEVPLSSAKAGVKVRQMTWNPGFPEFIAVLLTDGKLLMIKLTGNVPTVSTRLPGTATAVCWSPKGKQIVAGLKDGSLVQLTPDMQKKRDIAAPSVLPNPSQVSDLVWISTYQFGAVYTECEDSDVSCLIIVNAPKTTPPSYDMFEDMYYGMGEDREECFYLNHIPEWKLFISLYSGAYQVVTVNETDQGSWVKWTPPDSGQAGLPTTHNNEDTFPLGLAVTFAVTKQIEQDDQKFPLSPILFLLTTDGVLCPFYMVYKNPKLADGICHPPKPLPTDGERLAASSVAPKNSGNPVIQTPAVGTPTAKAITSSITQATNVPSTSGIPLTTSKPSVPPDNTKVLQSGSTPIFGAPPNSTQLAFGASKTTQATPPTQTSTPVTTSKTSTLPNSTKAPQYGTTPLFGTLSNTTPFNFGAMKTTQTTPPTQTSTPGTTSKTSALPMTTKAPQYGTTPLFGTLSNTTPFNFGAMKTTQTTKPTTVTTSVATSQTPTLPSTSKGPPFESTPLTGAGTPSTTAPPAFKSSATFSPNLSGLATKSGLFSFGPVSSPAGTKPGTSGLFQFDAPQASPLNQSGSSGASSSAVFKPGPINFMPSTAVSFSSPQPSGSGVGVKKPTDSNTLHKTEPVSKPTPTTPKTSEVFSGTSVKSQPETTAKSETNVKPTPKVQPTASQKTSVDVKKEDVPPRKEKPKEKPQAKTTPSKQEQLDAAMYQNILAEVEAFNREVEEARNRCNDLRQLGAMMRELNTKGTTKELSFYRRFMNQVKSSVEGLNDDVNRAKSSFLDAFELAEDARTRDNTATDPRHLQLLKNRGLDPSSERKMKDIRSSYFHLDNTLREVNMTLDEQWDKKNKPNRNMQTPCLDTIYQTMRQNRNIVRNQSLTLETISKRVNSGSLRINRFDGKGKSPSGSEDGLSLSDRLRKQKLDASTKETGNVSARKKSQLRQILLDRSTVPVRKTTFISDWRSRADSSTGSTEAEASSEPEEGSEKEEKPPVKGSKEAQKHGGKQNLFSASKPSASSEQAKFVVHSTPKFGNEFGGFSFSMGTSPSPFGNVHGKKAQPSKATAPKGNATSQTPKEKVAQPNKVAPTAKVGEATGTEKPSMGVSPRDAAAAAAIARASPGASKLDWGASLPAKTLVEHKAEDGTKSISGKDPNADRHARFIANAALKDAENKMKSVTQTPPLNTASTFTVRSSSSGAQSSGPPVMVLQPDGSFAMRKPGENPVLPAGKPVFTAGKQAPPQQTETKIKNHTATVSFSQKGTASQTTGFGFTPSFGLPSFGSAPVFGAGPGGLGGTGVTPVFGSGGTMFGNMPPPSFGSASKSQPGASVVQSPSREEGAGGRKQDEDNQTKSSPSQQTVPGSGKDNVSRSLFDKPSIEDNESNIVPERGEPEGESKQPVVTAQRQAAIGKSDKDTPTLTNVSTKSQLPPKTSSPSSSTMAKPLMAGFSSHFSTAAPFVFGVGDNKPSFGSGSTPVSTPSVSKATTESSLLDRTPVSSQPESQPTQRLEALGSGLSLTPPPFISGFSSTMSLLNPTSPSTPTPPPSPAAQTNIVPPTTPITAATTTTPSSASTTSSTLGSTTSITTTTSTTNPTFESATTEPVSGSTETNPPEEEPKVVLNATIESSEPSNVSITTSTSEVDKDASVVTKTDPNSTIQPAQPAQAERAAQGAPPTQVAPLTLVAPPTQAAPTTQAAPSAQPTQPAQPASSASPFGFGAGLGGPLTTSEPPMFGANTIGSTAPIFQPTQSKADTPASGSTPAFGSSFGNTLQSAGGFGMASSANPPSETGIEGGFSGLGGKPMASNRNPFAANPSTQTSESNLFGNAATSSPNPFQNSASKPLFGSTGFGTSSGNAGVGSTGFGTASAVVPSFGSPPSFGANATFGGNPTFGGHPSFGAAPAFGAAPGFGSPPTFGAAPAFGSGLGGSSFGANPSFGNTGSSPSRVFGAGTETASMFGGSSSMPSFGSVSNQPTMPSFGGIAGGQNANMNQGQVFGSSMSGSSFSSYR